MKTTSTLSRRAASLLILAGSAMALSSAFAQDTLRIGAINPYSGPMALYGDECARGYQLAIDLKNAAGGILGRKVELVRGDASTPQQGISAVDQLASRDKVEAFIGTYVSAVSNAASDAALRNQKIYWDTNALAVELTERKLPNFIRSGPFAGNFGDVSVQAVVDAIAPALKMAPKDLKVWVEHEDSISGKSIGDSQVRVLKEKGVQVLAQSAHNFRAADLTDSILRARRANPDVWMNMGYVPDTNLLLKTMREQNFKPKAIVLTGTGDTFETLDAVGAEFLEGVFVVSYPRPDVSEKFAPGAAAYLAAYRKAYNRDPIAPQGLTAYAGMLMLLETIQAAGSTDMAKVREAALKLDKPANSYPSGFGAKFNDIMQNTRALPNVIQWQSGKQVTVFPVAARAPGAMMVNVPRK
ncbi:MAG: ABC transporter substrate-binding protein [Pseudomonadota bacterium]